MRVRLIAHTFVADNIEGYEPHGDVMSGIDELAEQAGRLCYLSWDRPNPATATNDGYLRNIIEQGHFSVLEHASATFYIDGVSRNFTHELIRHRHLSFSEVSQRYVDATRFNLVKHPEVAGLDGKPLEALESMATAARALYGMLALNLGLHNLSRKRVRQAARGILPGAWGTAILVTGNMRAWREVLSKRLKLDSNGQPVADLEFYEVARMILFDLKGLAPNTFQDMEVPPPAEEIEW